jgi:hypothetical protein
MKKNNVLHLVCFGVFSILMVSSVFADDKQVSMPTDRFIPYEPITMIWKRSRGDQNSLEGNYSFRYFLSNPDNIGEKKLGLYLSYTGRFDFYLLGTRPSSPVVNRLSNPALHYRFEKDNALNTQWLDMGIEHFSNGQTIDANTNYSQIQTAYQNGNNEIIDMVSRSAGQAVLTTEAKWIFNDSEKESSESDITVENDIYVKLFLHRFDQDAAVYWGEYASRGENINFNNFQVARIVYRIRGIGDAGMYKRIGIKHVHGQDREFAIEWNIGTDYLYADSFNFIANLPFSIKDYFIPLALTAHYGPMNRMSNYTESQISYGIGLAFAY